MISWNVLRAAAELGITRVAQASSVNVIALAWTDHHEFDYFPLDEDHPCRPDEPYGLSKVYVAFRRRASSVRADLHDP